ncbi:MAG: hypothetical protein WCC57_17600 [Paracoccaceae bacterium]
MRGVARVGLLVLLVASLALTVLTGMQIARQPLLRPLIERTADEISAATDRMMAVEATPDHIAARLTELLAEDPRNWIALQAVRDVATERSTQLPNHVQAAYDTAWGADSAYFTQAVSCLTCVWDAGTCSLSQALICQAPVAFTPIGDIAGIARAGVAYASGGEIDDVDLALSITGLGATALVVASGGSSTTVKLGAGLAKLARKMHLLSPRLVAMISDTLRAGVDLAALPAIRSTDDLARVIKADALAPLARLTTDLGRINDAIGPTQALHLLRYVDDGTDARRLANAADALKSRTIGRIEILGKTRLLRATLRWSDEVYALMAGIAGLIASVTSLIASLVHSIVIRTLRRRI